MRRHSSPGPRAASLPFRARRNSSNRQTAAPSVPENRRSIVEKTSGTGHRPVVQFEIRSRRCRAWCRGRQSRTTRSRRRGPGPRRRRTIAERRQGWRSLSLMKVIWPGGHAAGLEASRIISASRRPSSGQAWPLGIGQDTDGKHPGLPGLPPRRRPHVGTCVPCRRCAGSCERCSRFSHSTPRLRPGLETLVVWY